VHFDLLNARLLEGFTLGRGCVEFRARPFLDERGRGRSALPALSERPALASKDVHDQSYAVYQDLARRFLTHDSKKFP